MSVEMGLEKNCLDWMSRSRQMTPRRLLSSRFGYLLKLG